MLQFKFFPSLLDAKSDPNLSELFRFAFDLRNVKPPASLKRSLNYVQPTTENALVDNVHGNTETEADELKIREGPEDIEITVSNTDNPDRAHVQI